MKLPLKRTASGTLRRVVKRINDKVRYLAGCCCGGNYYKAVRCSRIGQPPDPPEVPQVFYIPRSLFVGCNTQNCPVIGGRIVTYNGRCYVLQPSTTTMPDGCDHLPQHPYQAGVFSLPPGATVAVPICLIEDSSCDGPECAPITADCCDGAYATPCGDSRRCSDWHGMSATFTSTEITDNRTQTATTTTTHYVSRVKSYTYSWSCLNGTSTRTVVFASDAEHIVDTRNGSVTFTRDRNYGSQFAAADSFRCGQLPGTVANRYADFQNCSDDRFFDNSSPPAFTDTRTVTWRLQNACGGGSASLSDLRIYHQPPVPDPVDIREDYSYSAQWTCAVTDACIRNPLDPESPNDPESLFGTNL